MALDRKQFDDLVEETIKGIGWTSAWDSFKVLARLTAAAESNFGTYIKQIGKGPALGIFQMEPATHDDLVWRWLKLRPRETQSQFRDFVYIHVGAEANHRALRYNLKYAIVLCRMKYLSIPAALPAPGDLRGMAEYWKKYYNTHQGKGTVQEGLDKYKRYCT